MLSPVLRHILLSQKPNLLLDKISGASAAYSLRKLKSSYKGACLNVRRSSDSAEMNIDFSNGVIDTSSLLAFCGSNDGFVTTVYDQSGNDLNIIQPTTTLQPKIINSGVLNLDGVYPFISITAGLQLYHSSPSLYKEGNASMFSVMKGTIGAVYVIGEAHSTAGAQFWRLLSSGSVSESTDSVRIRSNTSQNFVNAVGSKVIIDDYKHSCALIDTGTNIKSYVDNSLDVNVDYTRSDTLTLDRFILNGHEFHELICFKTANIDKDTIIANQKTYYGIA